jgi:DNA-3-methyladenine glycosylase I
MKKRCEWGSSDPMMVAYHDEEWGKPVHDDRLLFEFLTLEGAQAGLNWMMIMRRREGYRAAFDNFVITKVAAYDDRKVEELLKDPRIVRNRRKIESAVSNAMAIIEIKKEFGSFDSYLWAFVKGKPIRGGWKSLKEMPSVSAESKKLSADLLKRGFKFVGPTICYSFMQAVGMVNDHTVDCYRYSDLSKG